MRGSKDKTAARSFEDLRIWQEARALVRDIYSDFREGSPGTRDYGFRNQLQSAGVSVMNNIAEGFERTSDCEFARFLDITKGSCGEVRSMYYAAEDLCYVDPQVAAERREKARQISAQTASLTAYLRSE